MGGMRTHAPPVRLLTETEAARYARWFAVLADATRVRLLHAVATTPDGLTVGVLAEALGVSQPTCSHHVRKLADVRFVMLRREGTATIVSINEACCSGLPQAADAVMGQLAPRPCCPENVPDDVVVTALSADEWPAVRRIYAEGIATGVATVETDVPDDRTLDDRWLDGHRWIGRINDEVVGWAVLRPVSHDPGYAGVADTLVCVGARHRGRGAAKALLYKQITEADAAGLWTLQVSVFTENRPAIALYRSAGFRTIGVRERIARRGGTWHDTVLLERRVASDDPLGCDSAC